MKKHRQFAKQLLYAMTFGLMAAEPLLAQKALSPILPLPVANHGVSRAGDEILRDPGLKQSQLSDDMSAEQTLQDINNLKDELKHTKGPRRLEILEELYGTQAVYANYLEDVIGGKFESTLQGAPAQKRLESTRQELIRHGSAVAKEHKNKKVKSRAMYHVLTTQYVMGSNRTTALKNLQTLSNKLDGRLAAKVRYLSAMHQIKYGDRKKGQHELAKIYGSLPRDAKASASLTLAQSFAGLNGNGRKVAATDKRYRSFLNAGVQAAAQKSDDARESVLAQGITIWNAAEGRSIDWAKAPFSMKPFENNAGRYAVLERVALQHHRKGDTVSALKNYVRIARFMEGHSAAAAIDQRIVDLQYQEFKKTKNVKPYESTLVSMEQKYRDHSALGTQNTKQAQLAHQSFAKQYRNLVFTMLQSARRKNSPSKFRNDAIAVANRYEGRLQDENERADVKASIAELHALERRHGEAVAIYMDLVLNAKNGKTAQYLKSAIASQRVLANWPEEAPWNALPKGRGESRTALREMYTQWHSMNGNKIDWHVVAHIGLLGISLNQAEEAFKLWEGAVAKAPQHAHAARASGFMLVAYQKQKNWGKLESTARLCLQHGIRPMAGSKSLNPMTFLADALFYGGKEALSQNQYADAVKKFEEFTQSFKSDKRRDEGLFDLSSAYRGNQQHPQSIATLTRLVQEYPSSKFNHDALLRGGAWALPMAYEEQTMFFYTRFLNQYRNDTQAPMIRSTMISLYLGRQLYGNAGRLMLDQGEVKNANREQKLRAALAYMDLEERYGDRSKARSGAKRALALAGNDAAVKAKVLAFEAREAQATNNAAALPALEQQLDKLDSGVPEVAEALAHVRFMMAESQATQTKDEIFNIGLKDPMGTLEKHYNIFVRTANLYKRICDNSEVAYCAPAMLRLSQITSNSIMTIQDLALPETLDEKTVNAFNAKKEELIALLAREAQAADIKASELVVQGHSTPDWTQEILWTSSQDWNFDRITGETGNGYVQWNVREGKSESNDVAAEAAVEPAMAEEQE